MPRVKKPAKVKEPIRLRMKDLANGNKSLYLDIYRDGKRTYEYLKMYLIPETDNNARVRNQTTMAAANAIKSKRIIQLTNGEAGIETREKVFLLDWMETYKENQAKRGKKDGNQIQVTIRILKDYVGERVTMDQIDKEILEESRLAEMVEEKANELGKSKEELQIGMKPNLVAPSEASWGGTTHPEVVAGIIEYLQEHGFIRMAMLEGSWVGDKTQESIEVCGYDQLSEQYGVPFWDMQKDSSHAKNCAGTFFVSGNCDCIFSDKFFTVMLLYNFL